MTGPRSEARADESDLLVRHVRGDSEAFAELVEAYRRPVYAYLVRAGVDPAMRDDLFQDVFLKVHGGAAAFDASRPVKPWLFTIVANTVRSHFRKPRLVPAELPGDLSPAMADPAPGADRTLLARDDARFLEEALERLPLSQREAILLTSIEGMDQNQVASALGIPVNTVKTHLRRGRMALAAMLAEREAVAS